MSNIAPDGRLADDGKRSPGAGRFIDVDEPIEIYNIYRTGGGVRGGEVSNIAPDGRLADDGKRLGLSESCDGRSLRGGSQILSIRK